MERRYLVWVAVGLVWLWNGCRNGESTTISTTAIPFHMLFSGGDTFTYDFWPLDGYGYPVLSSKGRRIWHVMKTGGTYDGYTGVTTVTDSTLTDSAKSADTLHFQFADNGDVFQHGFLARLIHRRESRLIPARWECLAAFSQGSRNFWIVGFADSAETVPVYGQITGDTKYYLTAVNGTQTVLTVYRVDVSGPNLELTLVLTDSPSAFAGFRDETSDSSYGQECDLSSIIHR